MTLLTNVQRNRLLENGRASTRGHEENPCDPVPVVKLCRPDATAPLYDASVGICTAPARLQDWNAEKERKGLPTRREQARGGVR